MEDHAVHQPCEFHLFVAADKGEWFSKNIPIASVDVKDMFLWAGQILLGSSSELVTVDNCNSGQVQKCSEKIKLFYK